MGTTAAVFTPMAEAMMMGDTVLLEDEVNPAMSAALDAGLEVTALHSHLFFDRPKVYFMHIGGTGDLKQLAVGVKAVYDCVAQVRAAHAAPASSFPGDVPTRSRISTRPIEEIFGTPVQTNNDMVKVVVGHTAKMHGAGLGNAQNRAVLNCAEILNPRPDDTP